jgi:hypothetical protein
MNHAEMTTTNHANKNNLNEKQESFPPSAAFLVQ